MTRAAEPIFRQSRSIALRGTCIFAIAAFIIWAICTHRFSLNDEKYFVWAWRGDIPFAPLYPAAILSAVPFFLAQWLYGRRPQSAWPPLLLVMASMFALMITCIILQPHRPGPGNRITDIMLSATDTGYFSDAQRLADAHLSARQWLADYAHLQPRLSRHGQLKPPGPLLFDFLLVRAFGASIWTMQLSAILMGLIASSAVPATYLLVLHLVKDGGPAFFGASFLALCPSLLFFPQFDGCYAPLTVCFVLLWCLACERNSLLFALATGLLIGHTTFFSYLPIVMAFFLAVYLVLKQLPRPHVEAMTLPIAAFAGLLLFYSVLWLITGFNPIASFRVSENLWHEMQATWSTHVAVPPRHLPGTIPWDLYSFALGTGFISFPMALFHFRTLAKRAPRLRIISCLCIGQILFVAVTGLIQSETARVWIFMQPLFMLPIGMELAFWPPRWRMAAYASLLLITISIAQNLTFAV